MATLERCIPLWMPPDNTVRAVEAGQYWDAVTVPQVVGLAALAGLDAAMRGRPGPVIWDTERLPRLYFLVPVGSGRDFTDTVGRLLGRGCHIAVPGATTLEPPGPYWLVPPDPDSPDSLVDPDLLAAALQRAVLQLASATCIRCGTTEPPLHPAGVISVPDGPDIVRDYDTVVCTEHLEVRR